MSYPCHTHVVFQRRSGDFEKDGSAQCRKACRQVEEGGAGHDLWEDTWHEKSGTTSAPRFTIINSDFQHRFGYPKYPINFTFNWLGNPEIQHVWSQLFGNENRKGFRASWCPAAGVAGMAQGGFGACRGSGLQRMFAATWPNVWNVWKLCLSKVGECPGKMMTNLAMLQLRHGRMGRGRDADGLERWWKWERDI